MSLAAATPRIKPFNSPSYSSSSSSSSPSSSSCSPSTFWFPPITNKSSPAPYSHFTVRSSQAEGPLRRPVAPPLREPSSSLPSIKPPPPPPSSSPPPPPKQEESVATATEQAKGVVTLEFQRQKAKELQEYFKRKKLEEADQGPVFGFIGKNEINNGRWAMFGFAVGMLTEYATGSDFVDQIKILLSNFGIVDLE